MGASPRYAIYWAPSAGHPLWQAGCRWLGRDAISGDVDLRPREATATPRRYGFHATMKAPMHLRDGVGESDLVHALAGLLRPRARFAMPTLEVRTLRDFLALRLREPIDADHPLRQLADACVTQLDVLRRPLSVEDEERRLQSLPFDELQRLNIGRYGHAFVGQCWQFHLTLSDSLGDDPASTRRFDEMLGQARAHFATALTTPLECDALCVFVECAPGRPFMLVHRVAFEQ
jgi:hypothetical protein